MSVISTLEKLGCKVVSRETTAGAQKWWLTYPTQVKGVQAKVLAVVGIDLILDGRYEYHGDGFILSFQTESADGHDGIFIAKPRKGKKGAEYRAGLDC